MQMQRPLLPSQLTYNDLNGAEALSILTDRFQQLLRSHYLMQPHLTRPLARISMNVTIKVEMFVGGSVPIDAPPEVVAIEGKLLLENTLSSEVNAAPIPGGVPPDKIREQYGLPVPRPAYGPRETGSHLFLSDVAAATEQRTLSQQSATASSISSDHSDPSEHADPSDSILINKDVRRDATGGRQGEVAEGYVFSSERVTPGVQPLDQTIDLANGAIEIDLAGRGISHAGMVIKDDSHRKSVKAFGDGRGERYSSVNGVIDPGPAGLMNNPRGGGLGSDGRQRLSFGNDRR